MNREQNVNILLVKKSMSELPEFAGTDVIERWNRQLDKLNIDADYNYNLVSYTEVPHFLCEKKDKMIIVFSNWIVDDFTIEHIAENLYSEVPEKEIIQIRHPEKGICPVVVAGLETGDLISKWNGWSDESDFNALMEFLENSEDIEITVNDAEKGYWGKITDEDSARQVEWNYLKFLQFRPGGIVAKYFNRPVSIRITRKILKYKWVTANFVTGIDFLIGLIALSFFLIPNYWAGIFGAILFQFNSIVDGVDGEVARTRHISSRFGANFDSFCDETLGALMYIAIGRHIMITGGSEWFFFMGIVAGIISYTYAMVNFHSRYKKDGIGFYYWWDLNKPVKVLSRESSFLFYVKRLFWRESIIFFLMFMTIFKVLEYFIAVSFIASLVTGTLMFIHIFIKKAEW